MTTRILIETGPLSSEQTFANDTKAQATLLKFYEAISMGGTDITSQEKLDYVLQWIIDQIIERSRRKYMDDQLVSLEDDAEIEYGLE